MKVVSTNDTQLSLYRYDAAGADLVATASSDCTVKVWDAASGMLRATLRGGSGHTIISCDISRGIVVGAGSDKTCRVWNVRTERMVRIYFFSFSKPTFVDC
jgi:WD40 repeat protein